MRLFLGLVLAVAVLPSGLKAEPGPWLPALFGDHMVVQADTPVRVWGRDLPRTLVTVSLADESATVTADLRGRWSIELPALKPGGPYVLDVVGSGPRLFRDVLVGQVWLGSGQSNMELPLRLTQGGGLEVTQAADQELRLFTVDRTAAFKPLEDVSGTWSVCSPASAAGFSAVAYGFGRELRRALKMPVGIIAASWGGTPGEDWVPRQALDAREPYRALAKQMDGDVEARKLWKRGRTYDLQVKDLRLVSVQDGGAGPMDLPLAGWDHEEKPGSVGVLRSRDGILGYRGLVQGSAWATLGRALFAPGSDAPLDFGSRSVLSFSARGEGSWTLGLGGPEIRDGDLYACPPFTLARRWTTFNIPLAEMRQGGWGLVEPFTPHSVARIAFNVQVPFWPNLASSAYNGMIAPLTRFPLAGVLWYQGESNAGRAGDYAGLLEILVKSWRGAWGRPDLPFLVVQLPGYADTGPDSDASWARLRQSQQEAVDHLGNAGLAVALDLGEAHDIHPKNKAPLARRLALLAEALVYGRQVSAQGPRPESALVSGKTLELSFRHAHGLTLKGPATSFEVAGVDGDFHPARAWLQGGRLFLESSLVSNPRSARYAWGDDPQACLYNDAELPAGPFTISTGKGAEQ